MNKKELDVTQLLSLSEKSIQIVDTVIKDIIKDLIAYVSGGNNTNRIDSLQLSYNDILKAINKTGVYNNAKVRKAFYIGMLKAFYDIQAFQRNLRLETKSSNVLTNKAHVSDFISALYRENGLTQKELCYKLNLEKSAMSNFLRRIENDNLFYVHKHGKYNYYYITNYAIELYNRRDKSNNKQIFLYFRLESVIYTKQLTIAGSNEIIVIHSKVLTNLRNDKTSTTRLSSSLKQIDISNMIKAPDEYSDIIQAQPKIELTSTNSATKSLPNYLETYKPNKLLAFR